MIFDLGEKEQVGRQELESNYLFVVNYCMYKLCTKVLGINNNNKEQVGRYI